MDTYLNRERILARFKSYVEVETTSAEDLACYPSSAKEWDLARKLEEELQALGLAEVEVTEFCNVLATLPANGMDAPVFGLIAHMDTSCEASGANVKMQIHENYNGESLILSEGNELSPKDFPELLNYVGQDIITSDGTTLLGADDKAGITAIMSACEYLLAHPEIKHGEVRLCFTPDEEIGRGTEHFPFDKFPVEFAYTIDGGEIGELNYETFNACNVHITFNGVNVHPGSAKHKMLNAISMASKWQMALPAGERPEYTENYEGFYHTVRVQGMVDKVEMDMILRDHNMALLEKRKEFVQNLAKLFNIEYGEGTVECRLKDCYVNMRQFIEPKYEVVEKAIQAIQTTGVEPIIRPIRGGTDGSSLSAQGIPCPNIFTGGMNFHGRFEYLPVDSLLKATEVCVNLIIK